MNKAQHTTRYIKHLAQSANFKGGTFNKHRNGLIGHCLEMPNVSDTHPLAFIDQTPPKGTLDEKKLKHINKTMKK